jgi:MFS family permease
MPPAAPIRQAAPLACIAATVFIDMVGYGLIIPLLPLYVQRLGGGAMHAGLLAGCYALVQALCGPVLGALADSYGRRPVLLVCLAGTGAGYVLLGAAGSLTVLLAALLIDAITGGNTSVAQAYVADISDDETRARNFGLLGVAFGAGVTTGPALAVLLGGYGLAAPAFAAAGLAFANLVFGLVALPESASKPARARPASFADILGMLSTTLAIPALRKLLPAIGLVNLSFAVLQSTFALFSGARFGWDVRANATLFMFVGACAVATQALLLARLRARWDERGLARRGMLLMAAGLWALLAARWPAQVYLAAGVAAIGSNLAIPALTSLLARDAGIEARGRALGAMQLAVNAALVAGPVLGGLSFTYIGPLAPLLIGGAAALLGALVLAPGSRG